MKKNSLLIGILIVAASCDRYSQVMETAKKEEMKENSRIYGEVDGPARQSKATYATPADAAAKSAEMKELMFGKGKAVKPSAETKSDTATQSTDTTAATQKANK